MQDLTEEALETIVVESDNNNEVDDDADERDDDAVEGDDDYDYEFKFYEFLIRLKFKLYKFDSPSCEPLGRE